MPAVYCNSVDNIVWHNASADLFVSSTTVDIWRVPVSSDPQSLNYFRTILHPDELARAARYHQEKDSGRFITSHAVLRILLGKYLNQQPRDIEFIIGPNKKPFVQNDGAIDLHYNISHSGDWILIAVGNSDIGVDVEKIDKDFIFQDILQLSFNVSEITAIEKSASPRAFFYLHWTRKEALTKATAKGLDDHLKNIPSMDGLHTVAAEIAAGAASWTITSFNVDDQHIGSVAYRSAVKKIRFLEY